jgi:hypothetical protein
MFSIMATLREVHDMPAFRSKNGRFAYFLLSLTFILMLIATWAAVYDSRAARRMTA